MASLLSSSENFANSILSEGNYNEAQLYYKSLCESNKKVKSKASIMLGLGDDILQVNLSSLSQIDLDVIIELMGKAGGNLKSIALMASKSACKKTALETAVKNKQYMISLSRAIWKVCSKYSNLEKIAINFVPVPIHAAKYLSKAIDSAKGLASLDLSHSLIGDKGFAILSESIKVNCAINFLCLNNCGLTDKSGVNLASIVRTHSTRRDDQRWALGLRKNAEPSVDDVGEISIRGLLILSLEQNSLGDRTAEKLSNIIQHDYWILILNIKNNKIGLHGAITLLDSMKSNSSMVALEMECNLTESVPVLKEIEKLVAGRTIPCYSGFETKELVSKYLESQAFDPVLISFITRNNHNELSSTPIIEKLNERKILKKKVIPKKNTSKIKSSYQKKDVEISNSEKKIDTLASLLEGEETQHGLLFKKNWEINAENDEDLLAIKENVNSLSHLERRVEELMGEVRLAQEAQFSAESKCLKLQTENSKLRAMIAKTPNTLHDSYAANTSSMLSKLLRTDKINGIMNILPPETDQTDLEYSLFSGDLSSNRNEVIDLLELHMNKLYAVLDEKSLNKSNNLSINENELLDLSRISSKSEIK